MLVFLIVGVFTAGVVKCDEVVLDNLVDLLLEGMEEEIRQGGNDRIAKVPDVNKTWTKGVGPIKVNAHVLCTDGKISSIGSIKRNGEVRLRKDGGNITLRADIALEQLQIHYSRCKVKAAGLSTSDPLRLTASHISVVTQVTMTRTPNNCTNELDYMVVKDLGKLTANMGRGAVAWIKEAILDFFVKRNHDTIVNSINHKLESAATKALLKKKQFCTKLFFLVRN